MTDNTYCVKSVDRKCKHTECPRNLNGFNGLYVSKAVFDCEDELNSSKLDNLINEEDD